MTERNQARLRPFDDPVNVERLVNLPEELARTVARDEPSCSNAIQIQSAVAIALELVAPLRAKNLAGLDAGAPRALRPRRSGASRRAAGWCATSAARCARSASSSSWAES